MKAKKLLLQMVSITALIMFVAFWGCPKKEATPETKQPSGGEAVTEEGAKTPEAEQSTTQPAEEQTKTQPVTGEAAAQPTAAEQAGKEGETIPDDKAEIKISFAKKPQMPVVAFAHKKHVDDYGASCVVCHHKEGADKTCRSCHGAKKGPNGELTFKDAMHKNCKDCHKEKGAGPTDCKGCHKK